MFVDTFLFFFLIWLSTKQTFENANFESGLDTLFLEISPESICIHLFYTNSELM